MINTIDLCVHTFQEHFFIVSVSLVSNSTAKIFFQEFFIFLKLPKIFYTMSITVSFQQILVSLTSITITGPQIFIYCGSKDSESSCLRKPHNSITVALIDKRLQIFLLCKSIIKKCLICKHFITNILQSSKNVLKKKGILL